MNPQAQTLIPHGAESLVAGLNLNLYKDKTGFINNITVSGLIDTDWSSSFPGYWSNGGSGFNTTNGALFETVFEVSASVTFGQYWTLSNAFFTAYSNDVADGRLVAGVTPCAMTHCSGYPGLVWDEVKLALNDSFTGWPITFNPYVTLFLQLDSLGSAAAGLSQSALCFVCETGNYDFFIGMTPTINLQKYWGIPVTLKAPTQIAVGPSSYWNGNPVVFGPSSGSVGFFNTGLTAVVPLTWMPAQYGHWFVQGGFQWYDIINKALQNGDAFSSTGNVLPIGGQCAATSANLCRSIVVGFASIAVAF
jgi:hypothetical protein